MTDVRRAPGPGRLTFISEARKVLCRQARLHTQRPREDAGRSIPPQSSLVTYVFFGSDLKSYSPAVAVGVSFGAFVTPRRRALSEVISRMQNKNSAPRTEFGVQLRLYSEELLTSLLDDNGRIDAFDTQICQPSNEKPTDGEGGLTRLTDLTASERRVYVAPPPALARPRPPGLCTSLPFRTRQIRQIRQTARRQRVKIGFFHPPGVKSVKSPPVSDNEVTA